jgi:hypothetical protein
MKTPSNSVSASQIAAKTSYDVRTILVMACIVIGIFIAVYAITVSPNDALMPIGFPP